MKNEMEEKKIYETPAMEEVEFFYKGNLLDCVSGCEDDPPSEPVEFQ